MHHAMNPRSLVIFLTLLFWSASALLLARINWLDPIYADGWYQSLVGKKSLLNFYIRNYLTVNPRIGEVLANVSYNGRWHDILISTASVLLLQWLLLVIILRRPPRLHAIRDLALTILLFAICWMTLPSIGSLYFYNSITTNYVTAFSILLIFTLPYIQPLPEREPFFTRPPTRVLLLFFGIVAGMTNEHTVPAVLFGLTLLLIRKRIRGTLRAWHVHGVSGLFIGYLLLFFAPGQGKRYDGKGANIFEGLLDKFSNIPELWIRFWESTGWLVPMLLALLVITIIHWRRSSDGAPDQRQPLRQALAAALAAIGLAHLMVMLLVVSPIQADKLLFAPACLMIIATVTLLRYWLDRSPSLSPAWLIMPPALLVNLYYGVTLLDQYRFFRQEFNARSASIIEQRDRGIRHVQITPYQTKRSRLIWGDDTLRIQDGMRGMEIYFDVDSISYRETSTR